MTKDLTVREKYEIMDPSKNIAEVINLNLGGEALSISDLNHIKTPVGGSLTWSLPTLDGDEENVKDFEAIIVHSQIQRTYWKEAFSGGGSPPDCFSNDAIVGIGDPGGKCELCPNDQFGSSPTGRGKACQTKRIMFLVRPNNLLPVMLRVPVGSLKNSRKYLANLAGESKRVYSVVTKFGLERDKNQDNIQFSKITFQRAGAVDDITAVEKYVEAIMPYIQQAARKVDYGSEG